MSHSDPTRPDWPAFLTDLDAALIERTKLVCIGGFAVTQVYGLQRETLDLDVVEIAPLRERAVLMAAAGKGTELARRHNLYLDFVGVTSLPEDYESRLSEVFAGQYKNLEIMALDPYDIVLTKLERDSPKDRADAMHLAKAVPLDTNVLRARYQTELRWMLMGDPKWADARLDLWIELMLEQQNS